MSDNDQNKEPAQTNPRSEIPANSDRWFDAQLMRLYTDVVNEPLPEDLQRLVDQLKKPPEHKK